MRVLKDTYLSRRFFLILMLGIYAFVMAYVFPLLFIWVAGALLAVLLLLFLELFELYKRVDGIDAFRGILRKQGYVMVEKRLNRVLDFAMEFEMDRLFHLNFLGYSVFQTSRRGEYEGNTVASNSSLEGIIAKYTGTGFLREIREQLEKVVTTVFHGKYVGYMGVDMMIYEDESGEFGIQPCVEINLRYNMGIVSIALQRYLQESVEGVFNIRFSPKAGEIMQSVEKNRDVHPLLIEARAFFTNWDTIKVGAVMIVVATVAKFGAAWLTQKTFRGNEQEQTYGDVIGTYKGKFSDFSLDVSLGVSISRGAEAPLRGPL